MENNEKKLPFSKYMDGYSIFGKTMEQRDGLSSGRSHA
jgi:hypothetical protein